VTTYSGDYEFYEQQRALSEKQQQASSTAAAMLAKEINFIERSRRALDAAQVQSRVKKLEKIERVEPPGAARPCRLIFCRRRAPAKTSSA